VQLPLQVLEQSSAHDFAQEPAQDPVQVLTQEPVQEPVQSLAQLFVHEPVQPPEHDPVQLKQAE
jgi:hypothetical protein